MKQLTDVLQAHFIKMCETGKLFELDVDTNELWNIYINSFTKEYDPIFRDPQSSVHNCNHCRNFVTRYGNLAAIDNDDNIITIWDIDLREVPVEYRSSINNLANYLKPYKIKDIFVENIQTLLWSNYITLKELELNPNLYNLGVNKNVKRYTKEEAEKFGIVKPDQLVTFNHLYLSIPKEFIKSDLQLPTIKAEHRANKEVFKRGLDEFSIDTLELVIDLFKQGSLLNGNAYIDKVERFLSFARIYKTISNDKKDNWCWRMSRLLPSARFRNELIGQFCIELNEGLDLNVACQNWNKRVDPVNYMKAVSPITKTQIENAKKFVEENGYTESFNRRFAVLDDINVSEILHINNETEGIKSVSIFDNVKTPSTQHKRAEFDNVTEVSIEKFMLDILPNATGLEVYLTNELEKNFVTLTTSNKKEVKPMFKWNNPFSWTYNGNLAGVSLIKNAVKSRGGATEGVLNIRLSFPNTTDDYDLRVGEPNRNIICFRNVRQQQSSSGMLDLDAQGVDGFQPAEKRVENVSYSDITKMPEGKYTVVVHNYSGRGLHTKCQVEIETRDSITLLELEQTSREYTPKVFAGITLKNGSFDIHVNEGIKVVSSNSVTKTVYNLETNKFHRVKLVCLSPNYWNESVGHKHYFFILENCKTDKPIRSFHNENLNTDLVEHRKVLDILAQTSMLEPTDKQLSGIGFNATIPNELIVKVSGSHKRLIKIKF